DGAAAAWRGRPESVGFGCPVPARVMQSVRCSSSIAYQKRPPEVASYSSDKRSACDEKVCFSPGRFDTRNAPFLSETRARGYQHRSRRAYWDDDRTYCRIHSIGPAVVRGRVVSKDGTPIAYERIGEGPPVILVGGGLDDGTENAPLARELARRFTVINYARRGRGESGDTPPYAVRREVEDLDALVAEVDGPAFLYGVSSGGALALEAAALGVAAGKVAVYEVPYLVGEGMEAAWREYVARLGTALGRTARAAATALQYRLPKPVAVAHN